MDLNHDQARIFWKLAAGLVGFPLSNLADWRSPADTLTPRSSQAMDVGTLKNLQADTIRILVWVLSFLSFGYATGEFEVTSDRLGVYRPEEHIE